MVYEAARDTKGSERKNIILNFLSEKSLKSVRPYTHVFPNDIENRLNRCFEPLHRFVQYVQICVV